MMEEQAATVLFILARVTFLDLLVLGLWAAAVVWGVTTGVIRQAFVVGALLSAMAVSAAASPGASRFASVVSGFPPAAVLPFVYTLILLATAGLAYAASLRAYPETRLGRYPRADRMGGGLVGFAVGLVGAAQLTLTLRLLIAQPWGFLENVRLSLSAQLESAALLPWLWDTFPQAAAAVASLAPA